MAGEIIDDNFLTINDDFNKYIQYLRLIFADHAEVVESIDKIIDENVFNKQTYVELTGIIKYTSKRVFPLLSAFFGQDENFENDIYHEFMDIQLMVLYLFVPFYFFCFINPISHLCHSFLRISVYYFIVIFITSPGRLIKPFLFK